MTGRLAPYLFALALAAAGPAPASAAPVVPGAGGQSAGSLCGTASEAQLELCQALESGACGLASSSEAYWFCKGLVDRQCGVIEGANYWFCQALTTRECGVISGDGYWVCRGVLEQNCALAPRERYWMCAVLQDRFRPHA